MKKLSYIVPEIEILDVQVENGFAQSVGDDLYPLVNTSTFYIDEWEKGTF